MKKLVFILLMSVSITVYAEADAGLYKCMEILGDDEKFRECISLEYKIQEALMVANYTKLLSRLDTDTQKELKRSQQAWEEYQDAHCHVYAKVFSNTFSEKSNYESIESACHLSEAVKRTRHLKNLAN